MTEVPMPVWGTAATESARTPFAHIVMAAPVTAMTAAATVPVAPLAPEPAEG
jgi:hypothetical protein